MKSTFNDSLDQNNFIYNTPVRKPKHKQCFKAPQFQKKTLKQVQKNPFLFQMKKIKKSRSSFSLEASIQKSKRLQTKILNNALMQTILRTKCECSLFSQNFFEGQRESLFLNQRDEKKLEFECQKHEKFNAVNSNLQNNFLLAKNAKTECQKNNLVNWNVQSGQSNYDCKYPQICTCEDNQSEENFLQIGQFPYRRNYYCQKRILQRKAIINYFRETSKKGHGKDDQCFQNQNIQITDLIDHNLKL